jgi:hypothetical protein
MEMTIELAITAERPSEPLQEVHGDRGGRCQEGCEQVDLESCADRAQRSRDTSQKRTERATLTSSELVMGT